MSTEKPAARERLRAPLLFLTVLIIATSGLVFELLAGTVASYVLGDSVTQFSTTIGVYLFAMGIGSYLSRFVKERAAQRFLEVELSIALVGGCSAPLLFLAFAYAETFSVILYATIIAVGTLVGLEIPLLMRILKDDLEFEDLIAKVLTFDYVGALFGSVLFAVVFVPRLGLNRTSLLFGMLGCGVALGGTVLLSDRVERSAILRVRVIGVLLFVGLSFAFANAEQITAYSEQQLYEDRVIYSEQSAYQRLVLTRGERGTQLFLNGNLQFATHDEYRYHESLVHPAFAAAESRRRVLVLGGGDGLALREIEKYDEVEEIVLVDLDPAVTRLARREPLLGYNERAFDDPRVTLVHADAMLWLADRDRAAEPFDLIIVDFPDPNNFSLGKLYTRSFYRALRGALSARGAGVIQSTSPLYARRSYWCIDATLREAGFETQPYHATVPSFGEWGYVLFRREAFAPPSAPAAGVDTRFLDAPTLATLFVFSPDLARLDVETNHLNDQRLVRYYLEDVARWN